MNCRFRILSSGFPDLDIRVRFSGTESAGCCAKLSGSGSGGKNHIRHTLNTNNARLGSLETCMITYKHTMITVPNAVHNCLAVYDNM